MYVGSTDKHVANAIELRLAGHPELAVEEKTSAAASRMIAREALMRILLLSMPDSFEHTSVITTRMPNGALASLAGNLDPHHQVSIADLVLVHGTRARHDRTVGRPPPAGPGRPLGDDVPAPDGAARRRARSRAAARGHASWSAATIRASRWTSTRIRRWGADVIVRGEGDSPSVSWCARSRPARRSRRSTGSRSATGDTFQRTAPAPVSSLIGRRVRPPNRAARVLTGYTFLGRPIDVVETSRGCTFDCSFCSIIEMRGRNFHTWSIERVLADIADARARGARAIFLVDDNITLNVRRFEALCRAIVEAGLNDIDYIVQAMTSSIAAAGETLAPLMRQAGFRYVFLGIENILDDDLAFLRASAKNAARREGRRDGNATETAIDVLHRHRCSSSAA